MPKIEGLRHEERDKECIVEIDSCALPCVMIESKVTQVYNKSSTIRK